MAARAVPVIDADALGREVWEKSGQLRAALATTFGPAILAPDGAIDQRALAREAFASEEATARLNEIVHPFLWARLKDEIAAHRDAPLLVIDAALIVEWRDSVPVDVVVVVDAPENVRRARSRDKYEDENFSARQARQLNAAAKRAAADIILDNSGSQAELAVKAEMLYNTLWALGQGDRRLQGTLVI